MGLELVEPWPGIKPDWQIPDVIFYPTGGDQTLATGINIPGGVGQKTVLRILRASQGAAIAVSEPSIIKISKDIFKQYDMWISPEGAACIAALEQRIVCFNAGSAEKYLSNLHSIFRSPKLN